VSRSRRDLSTEELKVWRHVTRSVNPLPGVNARHPTNDSADDVGDDEEPPRVKTPPQQNVDPAPRAQPGPASTLTVGATADMDRRTAQRLKRGEMAVDGHIDLHGLTLDQAHSALTSFIRGAHARGARCVIVVTGKGKAPGIGKIRNETPHWLNQTPLRPLVLAVTEARQRDGGSGAFYVLLKRKRPT
jgi:DNA-nicking Smr family endonuclease